MNSTTDLSQTAASNTGTDKKLRIPPSESYLNNSNIDYLARINMELLSVLWIARDRIAVLEELLIKQGTLEKGAIDRFVPNEEFTKRLEALRSVVVTNVISAPFNHEHTVESLVKEGKKLAQLHNS